MATAEELIAQLYIGYFDRAPDPEGLAYWVSRLEAGISLEAISEAFSDSPEAEALYNFFENEDNADIADIHVFLKEFYLNVFGREIDADGLAYYTAQIVDGTRSPDQIANSILANAATNEGSRDQAYLTNKVIVSLDFAADALAEDDFEYDEAAQKFAKDLLVSVTDDPRSIEAAKASTDKFFADDSGQGQGPNPGGGNGGSNPPAPSLSYSTSAFIEDDNNNGFIQTKIVVTLTGDTFTGVNGIALTGATVTNFPPGLTPIILKTSDTTAEISFSGNATAHATADDVSNLTVTFGDTSFTSGSAAGVTNATKNDLIIDFEDPDTTQPLIQSAVTNIDGTKITLTYNKMLDVINKPAPTDFNIQVNGIGNTVTNLNVNGMTVELALTTAIIGGQTVTLDYTDPTPSNDQYALQDGAGNDADSISGYAVTNIATSLDTTAPSLQSAETSEDGSKIILIYDESLDTINKAAETEFNVIVDGYNIAVTTVSVNGSAVVLTLDTPVANGKYVSVIYTDPTGDNDSNAIQDIAGNDTPSVTTPVTNKVIPPSPAAPTLSEEGSILADGYWSAAESSKITLKITLPSGDTPAMVGDTVKLFLDGTPTQWTLTAANIDAGFLHADIDRAADLTSDGIKAFTVTISSGNGIESEHSSALDFTLDTVGPTGLTATHQDDGDNTINESETIIFTFSESIGGDRSALEAQIAAGGFGSPPTVQFNWDENFTTLTVTIGKDPTVSAGDAVSLVGIQDLAGNSADFEFLIGSST